MRRRAKLPIYRTRHFLELLRATADYYDSTAGYDVADRFLLAVEAAIARILASPFAWPLYRPPENFPQLTGLHYRRLSLTAFSPYPFTIYYEIEATRIVIQSIYHHVRDHERLLWSELNQ